MVLHINFYRYKWKETLYFGDNQICKMRKAQYGKTTFSFLKFQFCVFDFIVLPRSSNRFMHSSTFTLSLKLIPIPTTHIISWQTFFFNLLCFLSRKLKRRQCKSRVTFSHQTAYSTISYLQVTYWPTSWRHSLYNISTNSILQLVNWLALLTNGGPRRGVARCQVRCGNVVHLLRLGTCWYRSGW